MKAIKNNFIMIAKKNPLCVICSIIYFFIGVRLYGGNIKAFLIMLIMSLLSLIIAFSPIGEYILRLLERARKIETNREKEYLIPIFEEVYAQAKQKHPDLGNIKTCVIDKMSVNACALGKHTIAVSKGAIDTFSEEELKAIIAHEIAHIINRDTMARLYITIGNGYLTLMLITFRFLSFIVHTVQDLMEASKLAKFFFSFLAFVFETIIVIITFLMQIAISANSRKNEFRADKLVFELGYGEEMINALYLLEKIQLSNNSSIIEKMVASHPRITSRIERLESLI